MFTRKGNQKYYLRSQDASICGGSWCQTFIGREVERKTESNFTHKKQKISIKQLKNRNKPKTKIHPMNISNQIQPKLQKIPSIPALPKFHFTYTNSNTTVAWPKEGGMINKTTIVEKLQLMVFKESNEVYEFQQQFSQKIIQKYESINEGDVSQVISTKANANHAEDWDIHNKQCNMQPFFSPKKAKFERGQLFNIVRRSQTILNDYKSDSQQSQVIDDYKSLMSKIQQNGLEEQYQEI